MRKLHQVLPTMLLGSVCMTACGPTGSDELVSDAGSGSDAAAANDTADTGDSTPLGDAPDAPRTCPNPTSGPTYHEGDVAPDEVWKADASPHVVTGTLSVHAKLSIEPCSRVEVDDGVSIVVEDDGVLEALGDSDRLITFTARGQGPWGPLLVRYPGTGHFAHVRIEKGGADPLTWWGCTLAASAANEAPVKPTLRVEQVSVVDSAGIGVCLLGGASFLQGSTSLTIQGSGAASGPEYADLQTPIMLSSAALGSVPEGSYTGNSRDAILVDPYLGVPQDLTVKDRGVPYDIDYGTGGGLQIGGDAASATMRIEPGVTLRFDEMGALVVTERGVLVAEGTASAPITFTSAAAAPAAGDWIGIYFEGPPESESSLSDAVVEYAGADCSCVGYSCESDNYPEDAAIEILGWKPSGSFVANSTIRYSAGHGINRGWESDKPEPDFAVSNSFSSIALCAQTTPRPISRECPVVGCP